MMVPCKHPQQQRWLQLPASTSPVWAMETMDLLPMLRHRIPMARIKGPVAGNQLFQALGGTHPCAVNNDGDPIAQYDKQGGRWVLTQFSVTGGPPFYQCIAVSTTSDATGTFNVYAFQQPNFNDYPKVGVWPDAYYATFNMFSGNTFVGARACAFDRSAMLSGAVATQVCFQLSSSFGSLLPAALMEQAEEPEPLPLHRPEPRIFSSTLQLIR